MAVFSEKTSKARKEHRCFWCGEAIEVREEYRSWTWSESGDIERIKVHLECGVAWQEAARHEFGGEYITGPSEHSRGCACEHGYCRCQ